MEREAIEDGNIDVDVDVDAELSPLQRQLLKSSRSQLGSILVTVVVVLFSPVVPTFGVLCPYFSLPQ